MDKIIEYQIISGHQSKVQGDVCNMMEKGWQPFGPPTVSDHKDSTYLIVFQVMVKYEKD